MNKDFYHSMKRGLALSLVIHVIVLVWGAVTFINPVSLPQQLEAIPITLAPLGEELSSQQGAVDAPVRAIPAVKPATKPQEKEEARHVGEGKIDSLMPFKEKEKPRLIETAASLWGQEKTAEKPSEELMKQERAETKTVTPVEAPEEIAEAVPEKPVEAPEEIAEAVPEKPVETPEEKAEAVPEKPPFEMSEPFVEKPPEEVSKNKQVISPQKLVPPLKKVPVEQETKHTQERQIVLPERPLLPQFKPKPAREAKMQSAQARSKKNQQRNNKTIEDILAMEENNLLNHARTQGGGAKRSSTPEALGARKNIDDITKMAQTLVTMVGGCIQQKLKLVALGGDLKNRPIVRLRFTLNREGMVMGEPVIEPLSGAESQQTIMIRQVYAAVFSCQPYADLPRDQYDLWGQGFDFNVDPLQEITR
ncbi:cell envelope biogenesis protein TolA [Bartonella acomydis]